MDAWKVPRLSCSSLDRDFFMDAGSEHFIDSGYAHLGREASFITAENPALTRWLESQSGSFGRSFEPQTVEGGLRRISVMRG